MHTLERLAEEKKARNIARCRSLIETYESHRTLTAMLSMSPLVFDGTDLGQGLEGLENWQIARELAFTVFAHPLAEPTHVSLAYEGPGVRVQVRSRTASAHCYLHPAVLLEEWDRAATATAARIARDEECAGKGPALEEVRP